MSNIENLENLSKDEILTTFNPTCIRQRCNWSKIKKEHKLDNRFFNANIFLNDIKNNSPKLDALLKKINYLDRKDEKNHGKKFKHFIFSDLKSGGYGAKMLAAALSASGWTLGYKSKMKGAPDSYSSSESYSDSDSDSEFPVLNLQSLGPKSKKSKKESPDYFNILSKGGDPKPKTKKYIHNEDDEDENEDNVQWGPIHMLEDKELLKSRGYNFYLLSSVSVFGKPISVKMKKEILSKFNSRPDNIHGDLARIIVMDSGFKEGIDLFDIKYIHIFEPSINAADQKQVIGRGTRTCGQKGLEFNPIKGWPLHVFIYDLEIPGSLQSSLLDSTSTFDLLMKSMNLDTRLINFGYDIERLSVLGSVDYELNQAVHNFSVDLDDDDEDEQVVFGGKHLKYGEVKGQHVRRYKKNRMTFQKMKTYISNHFGQYKWDDVKMENLCVEKGGQSGGASSILNYTPSQNFIRNYFKPSAPVKGMLLHHSVGSGKTCSAIAAASSNFEPEGYTILWVTRTTLKNDIWKNMFSQVCNESIRSKIVNGEEIPDDPKKQMRLLSKSWRIRPISYKQFSNLVSKQNNYYNRLVKENGEVDPLRKTLLIIDEAHKLYGGGDLSSIERPDMAILHESLMKSYAISGEDSVRLLLMTATPITESPMELIKLINLCKPIADQMPHTFDLFSDEYLNEEGHFTPKGQHDFLDDIAGHISYLNREKDARQFAQPIVKRVLVPIASDEQLEKMTQYDKFIFRSSSVENLMKLKENIEQKNEQLKGELSVLGKEKFKHLKSICDNVDVPKKICTKIVSSNISKLTSEIKDYIKSIKAQVENIKTKMKQLSIDKIEGVKQIQANIERNPEYFEKYKNSTYFSLRSLCGKRVESNKQLLKELKTHPDIVKYNEKIQENEEQIKILKNRLILDTKAYKEQLKQLKQSLKTPGITDLEKSMIQLTIKEHQKNFNTTRKASLKLVKIEIENGTKKIKEINKEKRLVYKNVKKTMKKRLKEDKKELLNVKNDEKRMKLIKHTLDDLNEDIEDEEVNKIVDRYKKNIKDELDTVKDKKQFEDKAKNDKKEAEEKAKKDKKEAEEKAKKDKKEAEEKAKKDKKESEEKAKKYKKEAEEKAKKDKKESEEKVKKDKKEAEEKAKKDKKEAEEKAKKDKKDQVERAKTEKLKEKLAKQTAALEKRNARKTKKRSPKNDQKK